jgi:hypothetical protein
MRYRLFCQTRTARLKKHLLQRSLSLGVISLVTPYPLKHDGLVYELHWNLPDSQTAR